LGDFELISLFDGFFRLDGGAMFGVVRRRSGEAGAARRSQPILMAMRPLLVRGSRTMLIDAGLGDKDDQKFHEIYGVDRSRNLDHALAEAGLAPGDIGYATDRREMETTAGVFEIAGDGRSHRTDSPGARAASASAWSRFRDRSTP